MTPSDDLSLDDPAGGHDHADHARPGTTSDGGHPPASITVVGLVGGQAFGAAATEAIAAAEVVVGSCRHLDQMTLSEGTLAVELSGSLDAVLDGIATHVDAGRSVCVLASGDPGFFGIVRVLDERFGVAAPIPTRAAPAEPRPGSPAGAAPPSPAGRLVVHPAPSSVALAYAALGQSWDDAVVASAHGRPLVAAVRAVLPAAKAAVLTSPDNPPEAVGKALLAAGAAPRAVAVVTRIGEPGASLTHTDLEGLAAGTFDPMSVVVLATAPVAVRPGGDLATATTGGIPTLAWGLPEDAFAHRDGMITKAEVRAVALGKLALPSTGVLWDLGAGSGSVAVEAARLAPGLRVVAVERDADQAARATENAAAHGVAVEVVHGAAPDALADLPDPDRVFVGGGGLDVLDAALERLCPGGVLVASYALVDRAAAAHRRLGHLVQLQVSRGVPVADLGVRLAAENPVYLCWGPDRG